MQMKYTEKINHEKQLFVGVLKYIFSQNIR